MHYCQVSGCARRAKGYARHCNSHRARNRRHGDPLQATVTTARLRPYVREVQRYIERAGGDDLWANLIRLWDFTVARARRVTADYRAGRPSLRQEVQAAADIVIMASEVTERQIIATVAGMVLMREQDARAFCTDRAFWMQVARRFRGLGDCHVAKYAGRGGRTHLVYRDANPLAALTLGQWLVEAVGLVGQGTHCAETAERERLNQARAAVYAAMRAAETQAGSTAT